MILSEVMTAEVKVCRETDSILECAQMMADFSIGFLPVVNEEGALTGTVTDRDITLRAVAKGLDLNDPVKAITSDHPIHLEAGDTLEEAERLMMEGHIRRIVVVDEQKHPIGVVSASDVVRHEQDSAKIKHLYSRVCEPTGQERTVEQFAGMACCD